MHIHAFITYLLSVCAKITIKMTTKLSDSFFLNSAVTLTLKFQSQMIHCLCRKDACPDMHETKVVWINWLIYFIYDRGHWPCLWPRPWISKVRSWNCHIYEISDLIAKRMKEGEFFGWFDMFWIISDLHFAFIVCCSAVQVWRFCR